MSYYTDSQGNQREGKNFNPPGVTAAFKGYGRARIKEPRNPVVLPNGKTKKNITVMLDLAPGTVITPPGGQPYTVTPNDTLSITLFPSDKTDKNTGVHHPEWADFDARLTGYNSNQGVPQNGGQGQSYQQYAAPPQGQQSQFYAPEGQPQNQFYAPQGQAPAQQTPMPPAYAFPGDDD